MPRAKSSLIHLLGEIAFEGGLFQQVLDGLAESTAGLGVDLGELEDVDAMAEADAAVAAEGETAEDATGA